MVITMFMGRLVEDSERLFELVSISTNADGYGGGPRVLNPYAYATKDGDMDTILKRTDSCYRYLI